MNNKAKKQLIDMYNTLIENEIVFYYGSEIVPYGEITELEINKDNTIDIELNDFETYQISFEDFLENHSKEGMNYHTWQQVREFDNKLNSLIN